MPSGLLVALPLESVAVRLLLALGVALVLLRLVSGWDLRSPRARSVLAVSPFLVAVAVLLLSSGNLGLPSVLVPASEGAGTLALPVADRYLDFAPAGPVLVAVWACVSLSLIGVRLVRAAVARRRMLRDARAAEPRVAALVLRIARGMAISPPRVLVSRGAVGGAAILGVRRPLLLLDARLLAELDAEELEGVLAHELAHVARRDNVLAWAAAIVRDVAFFVPGATWAVRALHREREAAADHDAVALTGRPAALASGLLHSVELARDARPVPHGCAALVPRSSVVDRVQLLLREERPTSHEHRTELALVAAVSLVAIAAAVVVPTMLTRGADGPRDALGLLVGSVSEAAGRPDPAVAAMPARVFTVYARYGSAERAEVGRTPEPVVRPVDLLGPMDRPGVAAACAARDASCVVDDGAIGLALRPAPIVLLDRGPAARWQATPVTDAGAGERFAMYWLVRLEDPTAAGSAGPDAGAAARDLP